MGVLNFFPLQSATGLAVYSDNSFLLCKESHVVWN